MSEANTWGLKRGGYAVYIDDTEERMGLKPRDTAMHCYIARIMDFEDDFVDFITREREVFCRRYVNTNDLNGENFQYLIPFDAKKIESTDTTYLDTDACYGWLDDEEYQEKINKAKEIIVEKWGIHLIKNIPKTLKYYNDYRDILTYYMRIYKVIDDFIIYYDIESDDDEDGQIDLYKQLIIPLQYPSFYTVSSSRSVKFGDGGEWMMNYPIWCCQKLMVHECQHETLMNSFDVIANKNNDFRENEPIQNIIDPSLYVGRLSRNVFQQLYDKYIIDRKISLDSGYYGPNPIPSDVVKRAEKSMKAWNIRGNYQWIGTVFKENRENNSIKIMSPIHNIGTRIKNEFNEKLYYSIEHVFEKMLPLFNQFKIFNERKSDEFTVIVKSQRYFIKPDHGYSGKWHIEGLTENIVLVGIYYYQWDKGLNGGNLKFRSIQCPMRFYGNERWFTFDTPCNEGTAMVFDNTAFAHRVRMLKNEAKDFKTKQRSFLAFFIVDPNKQIKTTRDIVSMKREQYLKILKQEVFEKIYKIDMEISIIYLICEYGDCGITLQKAKKIRKEFIDIKKGAHTKFGEILFGNCGYMYFLNKHQHFREYTLVTTTDSGTI